MKNNYLSFLKFSFFIIFFLSNIETVFGFGTQEWASNSSQSLSFIIQQRPNYSKPAEFLNNSPSLVNSTIFSSTRSKIQQDVNLFLSAGNTTNLRKNPQFAGASFKKGEWQSYSNSLLKNSFRLIPTTSELLTDYKLFKPYENNSLLSLSGNTTIIQRAGEVDPPFPGDPGQLPVGKGFWILIGAAVIYSVYIRRYFIFNLLQNF